ncbi:unnamed protein product [Rhizophagus irregularis]|nr:unnamed protein product [Rhizophagus irregularis]
MFSTGIICHLYGITQDPSTLEYMFIMRFAPQGDLRRYLLRNFNNLSLPNKLGIAQTTICAELEKIHEKGWVHGDLHSGNILLLNEEMRLFPILECVDRLMQ